MKQTEITIIRHTNGYIEILRSDGKRKIIIEEKYHFLRGLKSASMILGAVLMAVLFCGAAITCEYPGKVLQAVFLLGAAAVVLISVVVWSVTGGEKK